ncbi:hypothetical protein C7402_10470 [Paraburkholderia unamae]|uniref:Uncharacterized protein n=1 Tax=Paraburkholderia unamae TaxID=219649 RepID=A0ABX5KQG5_9BURK|nr:hypothetical protein C7402_10470 [Paraburkholderia unamae]CAG9271767.1 hypothetical protein PUN4_660058 [Paraburkholderia unamae]
MIEKIRGYYTLNFMQVYRLRDERDYNAICVDPLDEFDDFLTGIRNSKREGTMNHRHRNPNLRARRFEPGCCASRCNSHDTRYYRLLIIINILLPRP